MIGRDAEMALVDAEISRTRGGACRTVLVRGDAGVGKSCLLDELLERSRAAGFATVVGQAADHDRRVAYASLRLAVHDRLANETSPRLATTAARLDALLFGRASPDPSGPPAVLDLVHEVVREWADRQPLVLAIDDLHSADPETLEAFAFLARHSPGSRVLFAATVRSRLTELPPDVAAVVDRLRASSSTTIVDLEVLGGPDLAALIRSIILVEPSAGLVEMVEDATGGNPFFAVELVRSLRDDDVITARNGVGDLPPGSTHLPVPASAAIAVLHRVFRLGETALAVARVGSVMIQVALEQLPLVAEITRCDRLAVEDAFDLLTRARILEPSGHGYRFVHGIVRSALYDDLGPAERRRVHATIASHLAGRRAVDLPVDVVELATHLRCCSDPGDAAAGAVLIEAGDAVAGLAPRSAIEWYREGLALLPPHAQETGRAYVRLARASSLASCHADAAAAAADAMALLPAGSEWTRAAALRLRALAVSGQARAADLLFEELAELPAMREPRILAQRAQLLDSLDRLDEAATAITEADRVAQGPDRMWVELPRLHLSMSVGDWATGRRVAEGLVRELPGLPPMARASAAVSLMYVHSNNGDPRVAMDVAAVFDESPVLTSVAAGPIARSLSRIGRWDDSLVVAADAVAQGGDRGLLYLAWFTISFVAAERAEPPLDVEVVRAGLAELELYPTTAQLCLAYLDVAEGRQAQARAHLAEAWEHDRRSGRRNILPWTLDLKAELDWLGGDPTAAVAASEALDALVDDAAWLVPRLSALLTRALVRADPDAAEQAEQLATDHELPLELARARATRGGLTDDAELLMDAYARFGVLGAARRQRQVSMELRRLGRRVPRGRARQADLSAPERQLAALVAQGFTNREIADRVHLSAKTIEAYLSRIFRKTGCSSRLELALAVNSGRVGTQEQGVPYSKSVGR